MAVVKITTYRGYRLHLGETVEIFHGGEWTGETCDTLAQACQIIDDWVDNAR